jgi:hypothetical protein
MQRVVGVVCVAHVLVIQVGKQRRIEGDLSSRKEARRPKRYDRLPDTDGADERLIVVEIYPSLLCSALVLVFSGQ